MVTWKQPLGSYEAIWVTLNSVSMCARKDDKSSTAVPGDRSWNPLNERAKLLLGAIKHPLFIGNLVW